MLKSTSHRSIQHAKITKKPQYKNQIERKHTFRAFFLIKPILFFLTSLFSISFFFVSVFE